MASSNAAKSTKKARKITLELLMSAATLTKSSNETAEAYMARITHLHLQGKRLEVVENLEKCTNLKVLYLYDNNISQVASDALDFAQGLQYIYLQNNQLTEIPVMSATTLRKLNFDENEISLVSGLENCPKLEELRIADQRLPNFTSLNFDQPSLDAISHRLECLDISGNNISNLRQFGCLYNLKKLFASNNNVVDLYEIESIIGLSQLAEANFLGNPCASVQNYRDYAIGAASDSFRILDDLSFQRHQQVAIRALMQFRRRAGLANDSRGGSNQSLNTNSISKGNSKGEGKVSLQIGSAM